MNGLTQYDPFRMTPLDPFKEMRDMQSRFATLFNRLPMKKENGKEEFLGASEWMPAVDIVEDEKEYLIKAELPEIRKEDLKVTVQDGVLALTGERKFEKEEKGKKFHRVERAFGTFSRTFELPIDANTVRITAEFKDGLLKVHLPKSEDAKLRSVDVKIG
jgi:HSP20 family protein